VHQLQADHGDGGGDVKETWERQEEEQPSDEELQEFRPQTRRFRKKGSGNSAKPNSKSGESKSKWGPHLLPELRDELRSMNKCFLCYKRGHWAPDCPDIEKHKDVKKRRHPTDAELKV
jgi:hypothetical protein